MAIADSHGRRLPFAEEADEWEKDPAPLYWRCAREPRPRHLHRNLNALPSDEYPPDIFRESPFFPPHILNSTSNNLHPACPGDPYYYVIKTRLLAYPQGIPAIAYLAADSTLLPRNLVETLFGVPAAVPAGAASTWHPHGLPLRWLLVDPCLHLPAPCFDHLYSFSAVITLLQWLYSSMHYVYDLQPFCHFYSEADLSPVFYAAHFLPQLCRLKKCMSKPPLSRLPSLQHLPPAQPHPGHPHLPMHMHLVKQSLQACTNHRIRYPPEWPALIDRFYMENVLTTVDLDTVTPAWRPFSLDPGLWIIGSRAIFVQWRSPCIIPRSNVETEVRASLDARREQPGPVRYLRLLVSKEDAAKAMFSIFRFCHTVGFHVRRNAAEICFHRACKETLESGREAAQLILEVPGVLYMREIILGRLRGFKYRSKVHVKCFVGGCNNYKYGRGEEDVRRLNDGVLLREAKAVLRAFLKTNAKCDERVLVSFKGGVRHMRELVNRLLMPRPEPGAAVVSLQQQQRQVNIKCDHDLSAFICELRLSGLRRRRFCRFFRVVQEAHVNLIKNTLIVSGKLPSLGLLLHQLLLHDDNDVVNNANIQHEPQHDAHPPKYVEVVN